MLDHVVERFLHDAVERRLDVGAEPGRLPPLVVGEVDLTVDEQPAFVGDPANQVVERRAYTELVEGGGAELGDQALERFDRSLELGNRALHQLLRQLHLAPLEGALLHHLQGPELLKGLVV